MKRICTITCKGNSIVPPQSKWLNTVDPEMNRLYYIEDGKASYLEDGILHPFEVGKMYLLPSYAAISTYTDDSDRLHHAYVNFWLSPQIVSKKVLSLDPNSSPKLQATVCAFRELCKNDYNLRFQTTPLSSTEEQDLNLLSTLTAYLTESAITAYPNCILMDEEIISALKLMHTTLNEKLSISDIAAKCFMSTGGFIKKFTRHIGKTPYAYLKDLKVRTAYSMRMEGASLEEAAAACGYSDASALLHAIATNTPVPKLKGRKG